MASVEGAASAGSTGDTIRENPPGRESQKYIVKVAIWCERHPSITFALILAGLCILFYSPRIVQKALLVGNDMIYGMPYIVFASHSLTNGEWPFWNPYIFSGQPFQNSMLYPPHLLLLLSPTAASVEILAVTQVFLLGIFTYWFAREIGLSPFSAGLSALIFAFSEHTVARLWAGHLSIVEISAGLPLLFLVIRRLSRRNDARNRVIGVLCVALLILPGFPQLTYHVLLAGAIFGCFLLWFEVPRNRRIPFMVSGVLIVLGGAALSAVQLLPTAEILKLSNRGDGVNLAFAEDGSFPPWYLLTLVAPDFLGTPNIVSLDNVIRFGIPLQEGAAYVGAIAILLAIGGIRIGIKDRRVVFFSLLCGAFLILSFGKYTPVYRLFFEYIPGYGQFRIPARHLVVVIFGIAILAGFGSEYIWAMKEKARFAFRMSLVSIAIVASAILSGVLLRNTIIRFVSDRLASGALSGAGIDLTQEKIDRLSSLPVLYDFAVSSLWLPLILLIGFCVWWLFILKRHSSEVLAKFAIGCLVVGGLFAFNIRFSNTFLLDKRVTHISYYEPSVDLNALLERELRHQNAPYRLFLYGEDLAPEIAWNTNAFGLEERIEIVNGYDPSILAEYARYIGLMVGNSKVKNEIPIFSSLARPELLDLLNVRYILAGGPIPDISNYDWDLLGEENGAWLYRNNMAYERAYLVEATDAILVNSQDSAFEQLEAGIRTSNVILERGKESNERQERDRSSVAKPVAQNSVIITDYSNDSVRMDAVATSSAYLVLNDIYFPGWQAYVDGVPTEILRANGIFRAISLDAGQHTVEFRYVPTYLAWGAGISSITLALCVGFLARPLLMRRRVIGKSS